jgi:SOS-response transcriptional repressor LexA
MFHHMTGVGTAPPRRDEALAFIIDRIARSGIAPSYAEIGRAMRPSVSRGRAQQYVDELVERRVIERDAGARRGIRIRDLVYCRSVVDRALLQHGWTIATPLGALEQPAPCTFGQIPFAPPFEHLPDVD